jgi:hypothetical protein
MASAALCHFGTQNAILASKHGSYSTETKAAVRLVKAMARLMRASDY